MTLSTKLFLPGTCLMVTVLSLGFAYAHVFMMLPEVPQNALITLSDFTWADMDVHDIAIDGSLFKKEIGDRLYDLGPLSKRFRLAGTFLAIEGNRQSRQAVIDIISSGVQQLVSEGESLDQTVHVQSVFRDRVVLKEEGGETENIWLSFSEAGGITKDDVTQRGVSVIAEEARTLHRFGKRVGDNRWVLKRNSVIEYYQELLNNTARLANVFDSMKPLYEGGDIQGYLLEIEGEDDVFNAFGLQEGDVVRQVNSMPMTNRYRAEYFIHEFVANRANAFVLDIEREGRPERLIYMMR